MDQLYYGQEKNSSILCLVCFRLRSSQTIGAFDSFRIERKETQYITPHGVSVLHLFICYMVMLFEKKKNKGGSFCSGDMIK